MGFWRAGVAITATIVGGCTVEAAGLFSVKPNVVLLVTDDQRHDTIGFLHPVLDTPNMDSLATAGVWFSNAFATTPICSASRATMLTGLHERTHDHGFGELIPLAMLEKSYPALLRGGGYVTGFIGKNGAELDEERQELLFDFFLQVDRSPYIEIREGVLIHATDYMAHKAVEFIADQSASQPFLLEVAFNAPHAEDNDPRQFIPPERFADLYQDIVHAQPPLSDPAFFDTLPIFLQEGLNRTRWFWRWTPELFDSMMSSYLAMVHGVDAAVGEILEAIDAHGFADNTVVILISDNGAFIGERGFAGKWLAYDPSIRIPLIVCDPRPGALRGQMVEELVLNLDLPETILDLAGIEAPAVMQGRSLAPLLRGEQPAWRIDTFLEHSWTRPPQAVIARHESLRTDHLKYIHYVDHGREELYDLSTDPDEGTNLAGDPEWMIELENLRNRTVELRKLYAGLVFEDGFESGDLTEWIVVR